MSAAEKEEFVLLVQFILSLRGFKCRRHLKTYDVDNINVNENFPCMVGIFDDRDDSSNTSIYCITRSKNEETNTVRLILAISKIASLAGSTEEIKTLEVFIM